MENNKQKSEVTSHKKVIIIFLVINIILFFFSFYRMFSYNGDYYDDASNSANKPEDNIQTNSAYLVYSLNNDDTYNIKKYEGYLYGGELEIPSYYNGKRVTTIGKKAFKNWKDLKNITIPSGINSIGDEAFSGCSNLTNITIPDSVTSIGGKAFNNCPIEEAKIPAFVLDYIKKDSLKKVVITSGDSIKEKAFYNCSSLESITIPDSITNIGSEAFSGCPIEEAKIPEFVLDYIEKSWLKKVIITSGDSIKEKAFYNCSSLESITIPDSVTNIGSEAFYNCSSLTSIKIPNSVTSLGEKAFYNCSSLESITIPDSITNIGSEAFSGCPIEEAKIPEFVLDYIEKSWLKKVIITSGDSIKEKAFYNCSSLESITIPDSVTNIGSEAFYYCSSLTGIKIPNSVTSLGEKAFYNCSSLTSITIPNSVTSIGNWMFYNCSSLTSISIPRKATSIGSNAFCNCALTSIDIPDTVTSIGYKAFSKCTKLTHLKISSNVVNIGNYSFEECPIEEAEIPAEIPALILNYIKKDSLKKVVITSGDSIKEKAFSGCKNLTSITIPDSVTSIGKEAFSGCPIEEAKIPAFVLDYIETIALKKVVITSGDYIEEKKFQGCNSLENITIPNSVTNIGSEAFSGCSMLKSIEIPDSVTSIGDNAFYNCPIEEAKIPTLALNYIETSALKKVVITSGDYIKNEAFYYSKNLESIKFLKNLTSIGDYAFYNCSNLKSIIIPDGLISIGEYAFSWCSSLTSITIPNSVTSIGNAAFSGCSNLTEMTLPFVGAEANKTSSDTYQYPFGYIFGTTSYSGGVATKQYYYGNSTSSTTYTTYHIPSTLKKVTITGGNILFGAFEYCTSLTSITIPDNVTSIGNVAFYGCRSLTSITIPDSVTSIGDYTFYNCSSLTSITIPNSVTNIGREAFRDCKELVIKGLPNNLIYIGKYALDGCKKTCITEKGVSYISSSDNKYLYLLGVVNIEQNNYKINDNTKFIGDEAFYNCSSLTSITIPDSVTSIGDYTFYGCSSLTSIIIPNKAVNIGSYAFRSCSSLTSITIPDSVTGIGEGAFYGCSNLNKVNIKSLESWLKISFASSTANPLYYAHNLYLNNKILTSITIPDSVTSIGEDAFTGCSNLESITIPDSVTSIGDEAFYNCSSLKSIYYQGTKEQWKAINKGSDWSSYTGSFTIHCADGNI